MNLVIVESPAKGKTIEKYLGKDFQVLASFGHVRDLPEHALGVDVAHDFAPTYQILPRAKKVIATLKEAVRKADQIYLATDFDREGEAIAWHLVQALGLSPGSQVKGQPDKVHRITFHEITQSAIAEAIKHPRSIDFNLVDAQQARRILDRLVGYNLSPFLWKKVMKGLSAGRVQSVAVRLIVDREREIAAFKPEEYWSISALLRPTGERGEGDSFQAEVVRRDSQKLEKFTFQTKAAVAEAEADLEAATYRVVEIQMGERQKQPLPPFTTSTLQQEASHRLGFSAKKTMKLAQDLYEGGRITYMRTDSTNLATEAISAARELIQNHFGAAYLPDHPQIYKTRVRGAQEAHEAIRPTEVTLLPENLATFEPDHRRLYQLIWQRLVASQMVPARIGTITVQIEARGRQHTWGLEARGQKILFDGFAKVWPMKFEERTVPNLTAGNVLALEKLITEQHFTEPPARYNEASLIKALEEHGIGRPSTYAPTIATIEERGYVRVDRRVFYPTEIGVIVTDLLKEHFPQIVDIGFTAAMEENLDEIAEGRKEWVGVIRDFYEPFKKNLENKLESVERLELVRETTDEVCDKCGRPMAVKLGRFGKFLACTGFPDCRNTKPLVVSTGIKCPVCGQGELVERKTRRGKTFWSCNRYPDCQAATWDLTQPATLSDPNQKPRRQKKVTNHGDETT